MNALHLSLIIVCGFKIGLDLSNFVCFNNILQTNNVRIMTGPFEDCIPVRQCRHVMDFFFFALYYINNL